mgnify:CR=1 FL=1
MFKFCFIFSILIFSCKVYNNKLIEGAYIYRDAFSSDSIVFAANGILIDYFLSDSISLVTDCGYTIAGDTLFIQTSEPQLHKYYLTINYTFLFQDDKLAGLSNKIIFNKVRAQ